MPPVVIDIKSADDSRDVVHRAVQALAEGKLVAVPTETVYGVAASVLCEDAVLGLIKSQRRSKPQPLTLAIKSADEALDYVPKMCALGQRLARRCWPGPVTLIVENHHPDSLLKQFPPDVQRAVAPFDTLGLRVPAHRLVLDILRLLAGPVALSSACRDGQPESLTAEDVVRAMGDDVQLVLDDGRSRFGQPSSVVRLLGDRFELLRAGVVSAQTLKRLSSLIVLFVCTGNTCRSPMAEAMFKQLLAQRLGAKIDELEDRGVAVMSAGIAAGMGGRANPEAIAAMGELGLDLSHHESQPLSQQLVRHADLILAMTRAHRQAIISEWPEAADRVKLVHRGGLDIADPIGCPAEQYRRCAAEIKGELEAWAKDIPL